jgi:hypothetical protein
MMLFFCKVQIVFPSSWVRCLGKITANSFISGQNVRLPIRFNMYNHTIGVVYFFTKV